MLQVCISSRILTPENIVKIYNALGRRAEGKVAVKLSTGEPGNNYHLAPQLIAPLVRQLMARLLKTIRLMTGAVITRPII